jgi:acyl-coenzyme A thioesterase PaaI-like protein
MSDHLKELPPAAVLLGREVISVDAKSGEVQLRFLADRQFANRHALGPLTANARLVMQDERSALAEAELLDSSGQIVARARAELRVRERR